LPARYPREAERRDGVRAGRDQEVATAAGLNGSAYEGDEPVTVDDILAIEMATAFGRDLILDVDPRHAAGLELPHGTSHVQLVAVAGVGIGEHRYVY
jgi:hypothetical protein